MVLELVIAGFFVQAATPLEAARDRQDRPALERSVRETEASAAKAPNDAAAQYRCALAASYLAEVDQELRDKKAARQAAEAQAQQAQLQAAQAEKDKAALRSRLQQELNTVLQTRDSARGLIMNMSDVLFEFGKYILKPEAREKLAKVSGILLSFPGLALEVDGYTDNVGSDEFNQTLSEERARAVRDYLTSQGVPFGSITTKGFGKTSPIASDDTAEGGKKTAELSTSYRVTRSEPK